MRRSRRRKGGLEITADMYTYTAGSTGLDAAMPPWVQEGGYKEWAKRLQDPKVRERVRREMTTPHRRLGEPAARGRRQRHAARRLQERGAATMRQDARRSREVRGKSVQDTAMDLVVEDGSRVQVVYFLMSEDNVKRQIACRGSASDPMPPRWRPRACSSRPARTRGLRQLRALLGKYVRDEHVIPMEEAIRKLTSLPAATLRHQGTRTPCAGLLRRRRRLRSEDGRRSIDLREAAPVHDRRSARVGQRRAGAEGRRAHRPEARSVVRGPDGSLRSSALG